MAVGTDSSPEAEVDQPLDQAGADQLSPAETAQLDQIEAGLRDGEIGSQPIQGASASGSKSKLRRRIIAGIGGGLGLGGLIAIFFLLLLFKNIHIKNLFIDAEFARFNNAFQERMDRAVEEAPAEARGTVDTTVDPAASPEDQIKGMNAEEVDKLANDPQSLQDATTSAEEVDQLAGTGTIVDTEFGLSRSIDDESGKSDAEAAKDTTDNTDSEISDGETASSAPTEAVQEAIDSTKAGLAADESGAALNVSATQGFSRGLNSLTSKLSGPFVLATIGCIARDIFSIPGHLIVQLKAAGLAKTANVTNKYADCQKQGKCSLTQIGTIAERFDNSTSSFTQSCAYLQDSGQDTAGCVPPDDDMQLVPQPGSIPDNLVRLSSFLDGHVNIGPVGVNLPIASVCSFILNPKTQIIAAGVNVGGAGFAAIVGTASFGLGDVALASAESGGLILESKIGKALALEAAFHYGGLLLKQHFLPTQLGNMQGAGDKVMASASCISNGCRQLTPQENQAVMLTIQQDQVQAAEHQGLAYRLFSPHYGRSALGLAVDRLPTSPDAALASVKQLFGSLFDPGKLIASGLHFFSTISSPGASAATIPANTYGIPDYGYTEAELNQWGVVENSQWVQKYLSPAKEAEMDKCLDANLSDLLTNNVGADCSATTMESPDFEHYRLYKLDQRVTHAIVLLYNNQPGTQADGSQAASGATPVSGSAAELAQQLLANHNLTTSGRDVQEDLQLTAKNQPGTAGAPVSATILQLLSQLVQSHTVDVSALESGGTGHCDGEDKVACPGEPHYNGDAVDIDRLDGVAITGRNDPALVIMNLAFSVLPSGSRFGQLGCPGVEPVLPNGFSDFTDSCNHLHIDVPKGTP